MDTLWIIGGVVLVLAGLSQSRVTLGRYRTGRPWRDSAVISAGFILYGAAVLLGLHATVGAGVVWLVAIALWVGLWQRRRSQSQRADSAP